MHHPRHRFDLPELIPQSRVITSDDRLTPLGQAGDHRLPRVQPRLHHVTIVDPTTDNFAFIESCRREKSQRCLLRYAIEMGAV
jgi:hypothetical protein